MDKEQPEAEDVEHKSSYTKVLQDRGTLVKTIVAMANTRGGRIRLESFTCDAQELDSARLDDMVNKYAKPRIVNIVSAVVDGGAVEIVVKESTTKPHIFTADLQFQDGGRTRTAFHPGQVWVRHSSKNEPATEDDIDRMIRDRAARFLGDLSVTIRNPDFPLRLTDGEGLPIHFAPHGQGIVAQGGMRLDPDGKVPVRFTTDPTALAVTVDINRQYPHTTGELGRLLGKNQNWAAGAVNLLGMKGDATYHQAIHNSRGQVIADKYSDAALERLRDEAAQRQGWNPWGEYCRGEDE